MSDKPWWRRAGGLPPRTEEARTKLFSPGRVRLLRFLLAFGAITGLAFLVGGYVFPGLFIMLAGPIQAFVWTPEQRRQVLLKRPD